MGLGIGFQEPQSPKAVRDQLVRPACARPEAAPRRQRVGVLVPARQVHELKERTRRPHPGPGESPEDPEPEPLGQVLRGEDRKLPPHPGGGVAVGEGEPGPPVGLVEEVEGDPGPFPAEGVLDILP